VAGNLRACFYAQALVFGAGAFLNSNILAKLVVTTVVMIALTLWLAIERTGLRHANLPTDISASRRQKQPMAPKADFTAMTRGSSTPVAGPSNH
jgi:hypothetical protein